MSLRCSLGLVYTVTVTCASAIQVGDTRDTIVAQHGAPAEENHAKHTAIYRQGLWKVDVIYDGEVARTLTFTKTDILTENEITAILSQNSAAGPWRELNVSGSMRLWQGTDFAQAKCERLKPRSISVYRGVVFPTRLPATSPVPPLRPNLPVQVSAQQPIPAARMIESTTGSGTVVRQSAPAAPTTDAMISQMGYAALSTLMSGGILFMIGAAVFVRFILPWWLKKHAAAPAVIRTRGSNRLRVGTPAEGSDNTPHVRDLDDKPTLDSIGWQNFELLVGELFRRKGYEVEITSALGADGGKDLTLRKDGKLVVVQCKNLAEANRVTASQMRDFFGLLTAEGAAGGYFVTTGYFSADAKQFAEGKPIKLLERSEVEELIADVAAPNENLCNVDAWIDSFAQNARVVDPACPRCREPMKLRRGAPGRPFWGCSSFPRCRGKRDGREALLAALQWQPQ